MRIFTERIRGHAWMHGLGFDDYLYLYMPLLNLRSQNLLQILQCIVCNKFVNIDRGNSPVTCSLQDNSNNDIKHLISDNGLKLYQYYLVVTFAHPW